MADVVDLNQRRKATDPDLIEMLKQLLSEAQNGRLSGIVGVAIDENGAGVAMIHGCNNFEAAGLVAWLQAATVDAMNDD